MAKRKSLIVIILLANLLIAWQAASVLGQQSSQQTSTPDAAADKSGGEEPSTIVTLKSIIDSIEALRDQFKGKEKELQAAQTQSQKIKVMDEMNALNERIVSSEKNFEEIATGVDLEAFTARPKQRFDWSEEIQDLLGPIIQELKSVTASPREIEKLRSEIDYYEKRIPLVKNSLDNIKKLIDETKDRKTKDQLKNLKNSWLDKEQQIANQLKVTKYQLAEKIKEKKSFWESIQNIQRIFFKSRGRNFVLSLLAFVVIFLMFRLFHRYVFRASRIHRKLRSSFYMRLAEVSYQILTFACSIGTSLLVLYISGDWVLLGLAMIFLFGLAWAARQATPRFYEQGKILLNLGTVKENERVVYRGLPWKVVSLNIYTMLVNPELTGGMIRLPMRELVELNSRPYHPNEPWFPCKENDWIILADGTRGKVITQTPELVQLIIIGGSRKTYPTEEFLKQNPINLSTNFRLDVTFGIDYQHQAISTTEIPEKLNKMLLDELSDMGYGDSVYSLKVEFKEAGASSLDVAILADFSGRVAKDYEVLNRAIQRISVDACNKFGWVIPFTQLTLHTANSPLKEND